MVFPIGDENVQGGSKPYFSYGLIAVNVLVFLAQLASPGNLVCDLATIPNEILAGERLFTGLTSMFLHGGWMHLIGNMLYLWIFGDNIEACIGNIPFIIFYILGGIVASAAHVYLGAAGQQVAADCCEICGTINVCDVQSETANPCPGSIPSLGASGAIAAVMGAYLVMFPKSKIKMIALIFGSFTIPAFLFLLFWIGQQFFSVFQTMGISGGGVAWWAHIGGFVFGLALGFLFRGKAKWKHPEMYQDSNTPFV
jgi:membrane associated rhomboid family serine protease